MFPVTVYSNVRLPVPQLTLKPNHAPISLNLCKIVHVDDYLALSKIQELNHVNCQGYSKLILYELGVILNILAMKWRDTTIILVVLE